MTFAEIGKLAYFMRTSPKLKIALINGRIANAKSGGKVEGNAISLGLIKSHLACKTFSKDLHNFRICHTRSINICTCHTYIYDI